MPSQELHASWDRAKDSAAHASEEAQREAQKLFSGGGESTHPGGVGEWLKEKAREPALLAGGDVISECPAAARPGSEADVPTTPLGDGSKFQLLIDTYSLGARRRWERCARRCWARPRR